MNKKLIIIFLIMIVCLSYVAYSGIKRMGGGVDEYVSEPSAIGTLPLGAVCESNEECASGNCVGPPEDPIDPKFHCAPYGKECYFDYPPGWFEAGNSPRERWFDAGEPIGERDICIALHETLRCDDTIYCATVGDNAECHASDNPSLSGVWEAPCSGEEVCEESSGECVVPSVEPLSIPITDVISISIATSKDTYLVGEQIMLSGGAS